VYVNYSRVRDHLGKVNKGLSTNSYNLLIDYAPLLKAEYYSTSHPTFCAIFAN